MAPATSSIEVDRLERAGVGSNAMQNLLTLDLEYAPRRESDPSRGWMRRQGTRIDLHCHTTFSDETLKWLPGIVYHPLLTPVETYDLAKARGMDFVTITDHDTIDGCLDLLNRYGPLRDFIIGEEVSAVFPEDGTVVHVNVFDIDEPQHFEIQRVRRNIYDLVDYLRKIDKLYVLNHLTWTEQHRVLATWQLEAMMELFPIFEGLNGTRSYAHNAFAWQATQGRGKILVAGSDSHTHRVGTTYTLTEGRTRSEMLSAIRAGKAQICGAFGTAERLSEDVWLVMQGEVQRRLAETTGRWEALCCKLVNRFGRGVYPLICFGYNKRQDVLIRGFERSLAG